MIEPATEAEIAAIVPIWLRSHASDLEQNTPSLRGQIEFSLRMILANPSAGRRRDDRHPADDCWRSVVAMLEAYRAAKAP